MQSTLHAYSTDGSTNCESDHAPHHTYICKVVKTETTDSSCRIFPEAPVHRLYMELQPGKLMGDHHVFETQAMTSMEHVWNTCRSYANYL